MNLLTTLAIMVASLTVIDSIVEICVICTGFYAYPGSIAALTLWASETYQFPLTDGFFFGGLGLGSIAAINFFRDDRGHTFVERGVDSLRYSKFTQSWIRTMAFFVLYFIPCQFITLNADPFPKGYPSYMTNGICVYGVNGDECPGPGVMIPRGPFAEKAK